uniref:Uncharacterized protein n=1 Tax=Anguilla anguilla TaxID=7936 RepID=A0A0E9VM54_ANGAN
MPVRLTVKIL